MAFFCQTREYKGERRANIENGENKTKKCFNIKLSILVVVNNFVPELIQARSEEFSRFKLDDYFL